MDAHKAGMCKCHKQAQPTQQTLSEMDFDRGIWTAVLNNELERVREFVQQGKTNERDNYDYTALHYAALNGNVDLCKLLLVEGKAEVNAVTKGGATPLHRAALNGHLNVLELLVAHKANVEQCDADGRTALHRAASRGHVAVCKYLLQLKPNLRQVQDNSLKIAYEYVMEDGNDEMKQLLKPAMQPSDNE